MPTDLGEEPACGSVLDLSVCSLDKTPDPSKSILAINGTIPPLIPPCGTQTSPASSTCQSDSEQETDLAERRRRSRTPSPEPTHRLAAQRTLLPPNTLSDAISTLLFLHKRSLRLRFRATRYGRGETLDPIVLEILKYLGRAQHKKSKLNLLSISRKSHDRVRKQKLRTESEACRYICQAEIVPAIQVFEAFLDMYEDIIQKKERWIRENRGVNLDIVLRVISAVHTERDLKDMQICKNGLSMALKRIQCRAQIYIVFV
jgi:hypothetical protein